MDQASFDRLARRLATPLSRRSGIAASAAAAVAAAMESTGLGRTSAKRKPACRGKEAKGPCATDRDCCTGYCWKKSGKQGDGNAAGDGAASRGGAGRCRCVKRGDRCSGNQRCCKDLPCERGVCGGSRDRGPRLGHPCVDGVDSCASPARCMPYFQASPLGTYCLLRGGDLCRQNSECGSLRCDAGACWPELCTVCAAGCAHATVQAAIDASLPGATIYLIDGVYAEDLVIPARPLTLTNCNGGTVTLVNVADDARTIRYGDPTDVAPHPTLTIRNITVTGKAAPVALQPAPAAPAVGDGGIEAYGNLVIEGRARVTGCNRLGDGGGVELKPLDEALMLTIRGQAEITGNYASGSGGGVSAAGAPASLLIYGKPRIAGNVAGGGGGGVNAMTVDIRGNAQIVGNAPDDCKDAPIAPGGKACGV